MLELVVEDGGVELRESCATSKRKQVRFNMRGRFKCTGMSLAAGSVEGVFARACWRRSPCHAKVVAWDAVLCDKGPGANSTPAMKAVPGGQRGRGEERGRRAGGIQMQGNVTPVTMLYTREFSGS